MWHSKSSHLMSVKGHSATLQSVTTMLALPLRADIGGRIGMSVKAPEPDISMLLKDLISCSQER